ncbi:MAG: IreB family regulatory phosphoprotein [Oscillospiraceae bacterium]
MLEPTVTFSVENERDNQLRSTLLVIYNALKEKGYNPVNQIVGYILSEDPTYITTHNNARALMRQLDRDDVLQAMTRAFLSE